MNPEASRSEHEERESRITALLLGELTPAEADALRQEIAGDPDLARLHDRLQRTIGLVQEAATQPAEPASGTSAPVQLSRRRREKLLRHFKGVRKPPFLARTRAEWRWVAPMALAATVVAMLSLPLLLPSFAKAKAKSQGTAIAARQRELALATQITNLIMDSEKSDGTRRGVQRLAEDALAPDANTPAPPGAGETPAPAAPADAKANGRPMMDYRMLTRYGLLPKGMKIVQEPRGEAPATDAPAPVNKPSAAPPASAPAGRSQLQLYLPQVESEFADANALPSTPSPTHGFQASTERRNAQPATTDFFATTSNFSWLEAQAPAKAPRPAFIGQPNATADRWFFDGDNSGVVAHNGAFGGYQAGEFGRLSKSAVAGSGMAGGMGGMGGMGVGGASGYGAVRGGNALFGQAVVETERLGRDTAGARPEERKAAEGRQLGYYAYAGNAQPAQSAPAPAIAAPAAKELASATTLSRTTAAGLEKAPAATRGRAGAPTPGAQPAGTTGLSQEAIANLDAVALTTLPQLGDTPMLGTELHWGRADKAGPGGPAARTDTASRRLRESSTRAPAPEQPALQQRTAGLAAAPAGEVVATTPATPIETAQVQAAVTEVDGGLAPPAVRAADRVEELREGAEEARDRLEVAKKVAAAGRPMSAVPQRDGLMRIQEKAKAEQVAPPPAEAAPVIARTPPPEPQPEVAATDNPFSTFSLNVADVSFKLADATLEKGALPDPGGIRSEEFVNAFNYCDPEPAPGMPVGFVWERAQYPFAHDRELLRFSIRTAARGRDGARPLNLVLLLDNSGSMERADRVQIIREALAVLAEQLQPQDRISVVAFARTARLWVDALPGAQAPELVGRVGNLSPEGGTNLEDALNLAYATARRHFLPQGVNRVVLLTDGAANLGEVDPGPLKAKVEDFRKRGIALDCFGIGWEGYNDDLLEVLSRNGDGRYGFVNTPEEAATELAGQLAGALQVAAADVKVQIEFNPHRTLHWRQVGYAKHQLAKEQFRDNTVDAAELGAAESGNALYVVQVNPQGSGPLAILRVRFREPATELYRELEWPVAYNGPAAPLDQASASLRLAAVSAAFSEWLATSPFAGDVSPDRLLALLRGVPEAFDPDPRPKKLEWMIRQAKSISGR